MFGDENGHFDTLDKNDDNTKAQSLKSQIVMNTVTHWKVKLTDKLSTDLVKLDLKKSRNEQNEKSLKEEADLVGTIKSKIDKLIKRQTT